MGKRFAKNLPNLVELYSLTNYVKNIHGPIQIHQGTADDAVPVKWTDEFVKILQDNSINVEYFTYPGSDHNFSKNWNTVLVRDIDFFTKYFVTAEM